MQGEGELKWERFQFQEDHYRFTEGSEAVVVNDGSVALDMRVAGPQGSNRTFVIPPSSSVVVNLTEEGDHRLQALTYPWGETTIEVRSANPFVRFYEDLF